MTPASRQVPQAPSVDIQWVEAPGTQVFVCDEHGPINIPLDKVLDVTGRLRLNSEIEHGDYFSVSLKAGQLTLRSRGYVGYVPLNERIIVYVRPRVPIENLTRIVAFSGYAPTVLSTIRSYGTTDEWNDSLVKLYAVALVDGIEYIIATGMLTDYERHEETSSFPRGRILMHQTIQQHLSRNIRHSAQVAWYGRTSDNSSNQCLKYALAVVANGYLKNPPTDSLGRRLQRRINAIYPAFSLVGLDHSRSFLADSMVRGSQHLPTVRSYYRDVLDVAQAIIEQKGVLLESTDAGLRLPSLVLDMEKVFESYIRRTLTLYALEAGWPANVLDGNLYPGAKALFDEFPSPEATPDIVVRQASGATPLVCEVKNIPVKGRGGFSERDAINQVVTYAASYQAKASLLVHPCASRSQASGMRKLGSIKDKDIYQYRFNLAAHDLAAERRSFGDAVARIIAWS